MLLIGPLAASHGSDANDGAKPQAAFSRHIPNNSPNPYAPTHRSPVEKLSDTCEKPAPLTNILAH